MAACLMRRSAGCPSCTFNMPAESMDRKLPMPALSATAFMMASAAAERQMLPKQTNRMLVFLIPLFCRLRLASAPCVQDSQDPYWSVVFPPLFCLGWHIGPKGRLRCHYRQAEP